MFFRFLGYYYALTEDRIQTGKILNSDMDKLLFDYYFKALICLGLEDHDKMFEYLDKAYEVRDSWLL